MSKYDKFATQLGFKDRPKDNTSLSNLTRTPKKGILGFVRDNIVLSKQILSQ
jgi:hypothetical protein